jgi:hypothetical protein
MSSALQNALFPLRAAPPASPSDHRYMTTWDSRCQSSVKGWIGNCHLWSRSVPRACHSFPHWETSTSTSTQIQNQIGKATSGMGHGWNYYAHLPLKNLYLSEKIALCIGPALQELAEGRFSLPLRIFSWRGSSHRDLSKKALDILFPPDRLSVTV